MEAPEKIYLFENPIDGTPDYRWLSKRSCNDDVEYVRKDAFIEKACEWLKFNYAEFTDNSRLGLNINELIKDFKKDFKKSMEE